MDPIYSTQAARANAALLRVQPVSIPTKKEVIEVAAPAKEDSKCVKITEAASASTVAVASCDVAPEVLPISTETTAKTSKKAEKTTSNKKKAATTK